MSGWANQVAALLTWPVITEYSGDMTNITTCITCHEDKPETEFWKDARKKTGRFSECRTCGTARNKDWINGNRERYRAKNLEATHRYRVKDPRQRLLDYCRRRAPEKGLEFSLKVEDLEWPDVCPILGIPIESAFGKCGPKRGHRLRDHAPSIDRIDNAKGYTKDNSVVVSFRANRIKSDATPEELMKVAKFYEQLGR